MRNASLSNKKSIFELPIIKPSYVLFNFNANKNIMEADIPGSNNRIDLKFCV